MFEEFFKLCSKTDDILNYFYTKISKYELKYLLYQTRVQVR